MTCTIRRAQEEEEEEKNVNNNLCSRPPTTQQQQKTHVQYCPNDSTARAVPTRVRGRWDTRVSGTSTAQCTFHKKNGSRSTYTHSKRNRSTRHTSLLPACFRETIFVAPAARCPALRQWRCGPAIESRWRRRPTCRTLSWGSRRWEQSSWW